MKICDFTEPELTKFRKECNFTDQERNCFDLKAKGLTNYQIAMQLNICDSSVSSTMKSIRAKITAVSEKKETQTQETANANPLNPLVDYLMGFLTKFLENSPFIPESHSTKEWLEIPDRVSVKDKFYVVTDYRTDDNSPSVPRLKFGDGVTMISKLPFCTAAITDNDVRLWDLQMQISQKKQ